jgi:hypothetical protein
MIRHVALVSLSSRWGFTVTHEILRYLLDGFDSNAVPGPLTRKPCSLRVCAMLWCAAAGWAARSSLKGRIGPDLFLSGDEKIGRHVTATVFERPHRQAR